MTNQGADLKNLDHYQYEVTKELALDDHSKQDIGLSKANKNDY